MMITIISNIKRVLPAALVCGGLFASLFTFPVAVSAGEDLTGSPAESSVSANAESDSSVSASAENDSSVPPTDESSLSLGEEFSYIMKISCFHTFFTNGIEIILRTCNRHKDIYHIT